MQGFEGCASFGFSCGLPRDIGVVGAIRKKTGRVRITGAAVDAALVDEEIAGGVFRKNSMFRVCDDT